MRLSLFLICSAALLAQDPKEPRESETVRYKEFAEIVEGIAGEVEKNDKALVVWLVDNAPMLKASRHGDLLADAIPRCFRKPGVSHAVVALGETPRLVQKPVEDAVRAAAAVTALANGAPDNAIKNCLLNIREAARVASGFSGGKKYVVLFTQENADNEDDVEGTIKTLKAGGIALVPIVPEAVYSDPYWESALAGTSRYSFDVEKLKKLPFKLKGPEGAFLEFPYGWPFAWIDPGYTVPSGYPPWAIDRVATLTGGRSYLYSVDRAADGFCRRYGCPLCSGSHRSCGASFEVTKLKLTQPFLGSRNEYGARYGKDKLYLAILGAWEKLAREGVFRGPPPLKGGGGALSENVRSAKARPAEFSITVGEWKAQRQDAIKRADSVEKAANGLLATAKKEEKEADRRTLATAEALAVHLKLLSQSYRQFAAFCEQMDRAGKTKKPAPDGVAASDLEPAPGDRLLTWYWQSYFLCHGGAPLKEIKFLGDLKGLHEALDLADQAIEKHRGTPWEVLIRRASIPAFTVWYETKEQRDARAATPDRPKARSTSGQAQNETPGSGVGRPARPVRGDEGRAGPGTSTGGNP